ncbi:MAG: hypothetical protein RLZZ265_2237 [Verrucomicrobiota bacterium]
MRDFGVGQGGETAAVILLRRALPYGLPHENRTPPNFQTGSKLRQERHGQAGTAGLFGDDAAPPALRIRTDSRLARSLGAMLREESQLWKRRAARPRSQPGR